jgi:hypothetical protein
MRDKEKSKRDRLNQVAQKVAQRSLEQTIAAHENS